MKKTMSVLIFSTVLLFAVSAIAANNVVVIPLNTCNDPDLLPENICLGVSICDVTGTKTCTRDTYGTVTSTTGRVWLDRNLGASQAATEYNDSAAYGDLYQWGRLTDGHQSRTSHTNTTPSNSDVPGHGSFILVVSPYPWDWFSGQNNDLWQGVSGTNNPCPEGFRLPTATEWEAEMASWGSNQNTTGAIASPLKLVVAGGRSRTDDSLILVGSDGLYWSSTVNNIYSRFLRFNSGDAIMSNSYRAPGYSVRCIKD